MFLNKKESPKSHRPVAEGSEATNVAEDAWKRDKADVNDDHFFKFIAVVLEPDGPLVNLIGIRSSYINLYIWTLKII